MLEDCSFLLKAKKGGSGFKFLPFLEHIACRGNNLIVKYNRTYNFIVEKAATEIITFKITSTIKDITAYVKGATEILLNWDQANYYKAKALKSLGLDEITSYREIENYFNILKEVYLGSNCNLVVENGKSISLSPWIYLYLGCKREVITLNATF